MKYAKSILASAALCLAASAALSQTADTMPMAGMDHSGMKGMDTAAMTPSAAYMHAMDVMMENMADMSMTGDAEIDFLVMMIPHHQSAVDMSIALLPTVKDPELKAFAEGVIAAQEGEIAAMKDMLVRLGYQPK